jgi:hypothetical protein
MGGNQLGPDRIASTGIKRDILVTGSWYRPDGSEHSPAGQRGPATGLAGSWFTAALWAHGSTEGQLTGLQAAADQQIALRIHAHAYHRILAQTVRPVTVRSLDAIHLGTAMDIRRSLTSFVTYDKRPLDAAAAAADEEFTFEAEIFTRRIKAAEEAAEKAAEARSEGKSLLSVLGARGFTVTAALRKEILDCGDSARLEGALLRAATGDPRQPFTF